MRTNFAAQVADWAERTKENQTLVVREAAQDTMELAQRKQVSMARGAMTVQRGAIPVDTGYLANTLASDLNGAGAFATDQIGPTFELTIAQMEAGDIAHFAWTAEYAMAINYGHGTYPGAHWVEAAAAEWPRLVAAAAEKYRR